uniref:Migration and invasion inhibitory protein n=1 Tax=Periophthalmus magnuspinnatus TaxID=409849 RepID=A0A3B4AI18_9GOBI
EVPAHAAPRANLRRGSRQQSEEAQSSIGRHHLTPLLGYDWIADAEDSLMERSDDFFNDLCRFRALNREQCVNSRHSGLYLICYIITGTFSYRINNRLFPVPLISEECCPVCKKHKSEHPHTAKEPALIRVSIPRSTLLPPHKYKAHRRCSFDPSDSLSLPSVSKNCIVPLLKKSFLGINDNAPHCLLSELFTNFTPTHAKLPFIQSLSTDWSFPTKRKICCSHPFFI